jgi:hypothetical protein
MCQWAVWHAYHFIFGAAALLAELEDEEELPTLLIRVVAGPAAGEFVLRMKLLVSELAFQPTM